VKRPDEHNYLASRTNLVPGILRLTATDGGDPVAASELAATSSLWLEIGAQRRHYNRQIRPINPESLASDRAKV